MKTNLIIKYFIQLKVLCLLLERTTNSPKITASGYFTVGFHLIPTVNELMTMNFEISSHNDHVSILDYRDYIDISSSSIPAYVIRKHRKLLPLNRLFYQLSTNSLIGEMQRIQYTAHTLHHHFLWSSLLCILLMQCKSVQSNCSSKINF